MPMARSPMAPVHRPLLQLPGRPQADPSSSGRRRPGHPGTPRDCGSRGISPGLARPRVQDRACAAAPGRRRSGSWVDTQHGATRPGTVHGPRYRQGRTALLARAWGFRRPRVAQAPLASSQRIRAHLRARRKAACPGRRGYQAAMASSEPITHTFGCASTRLTNAFSCLRRANCLRVYTVGFTGRSSCAATGSSAANRSG